MLIAVPDRPASAARTRWNAASASSARSAARGDQAEDVVGVRPIANERRAPARARRRGVGLAGVEERDAEVDAGERRASDRCSSARRNAAVAESKSYCSR